MMSSADAIIWHIEDDPQMRSTVMGVWELDGAPTPERMRESLDRMITAIPRLRQRVEPGRPRPRWVEVEQVDIDHHVVELELGGDGDMQEVERFAQQWVRQPFDRTQPQWGLAVARGLSGGRAAIVIKVHHAIADGIGLVLMLAAFTDLEPNPERPAVPDNVVELPLRRRPFTSAGRAVFKARRGVVALASAPVRSLRNAAALATSITKLVWPSRTPLSTVMTDRSGRLCLDTRTFSLEDFKRAGRAAGGTINDTFVAVVIDALDRYHRAFGAKRVIPSHLRVHMPVDVRAGRTTSVAGNEFVPARLAVEIPRGSVAHRTRHIAGQLAALQNEPALGHINHVAAGVLRLGRRPTRWILGGMMKGVDVLASNVPGPGFPLYVAGVKVTRFHAFGPPAGAAINITLFSYDGTINLGITTDEAAVTDRDLLLLCIDDAVADLLRPNQRVAVPA